MKKIILIGGGGHCGSVIDSMKSTSEYHPIGILDIPSRVGEMINDVKVIDTDDAMQSLYDQGVHYAFLSVGSIGSPYLKLKLYEKSKSIGFTFPVIKDVSSIVSQNAQIGEGTFIGKGAIINSNCTVGKHSIINSGAVLEHDSIVGDFTHLAPGVVCSGGVTIGSETHIGTNATIIQDIHIGNQTIIGAGSLVLKDVGDHAKAYGNPAKEVQND